MSKIIVITTANAVYTTFYNTIHLKKEFSNEDEKREAYDMACSLAFKKACTSTTPTCLLKELPNVDNDIDVFEYLGALHGRIEHKYCPKAYLSQEYFDEVVYRVENSDGFVHINCLDPETWLNEFRKCRPLIKSIKLEPVEGKKFKYAVSADI